MIRSLLPGYVLYLPGMIYPGIKLFVTGVYCYQDMRFVVRVYPFSPGYDTLLPGYALYYQGMVFVTRV